MELEVAVKPDTDKNPIIKALGAGAIVTGAVAAGYAAGKVKGVLDSLSEPRPPYAWRPERGRSVFLKGANVLDVRRGQMLRERGLLFTDGQISDLVSTRDLDKVEAYRTFDCRGLFLTPGLVNAHCHILMPCAATISLDLLMSVKRQAVRNVEECARHGVTTVRDAAGLPLILREIARGTESFEILGPRLLTCGSSLMPKGGYPDFSKPLPGWLDEKYGSPAVYVSGPESARESVRQVVDQGARFIKIFFDDRSLFFGHKPLNTFDDETVLSLLDEAHRLGRRVAVHQSQLSGFRRAVRLGVDDLEHVPMDGEITADDVASFMKGDHHITPTASVTMALGIAPPGNPARYHPLVEALQGERERLLSRVGPAVSEAAVMESNLRMVRGYMEGTISAGRGKAFTSDNELVLKAIQCAGPTVEKLYQAGATMCCGNDGGTPLSFPGYMVSEMVILEWLGMSRADILKAATLNGAGLLELEGEIGSLEAGKLADILVLSANPLEDLMAMERVEGVFRSGVLLHRGPRLALETQGLRI